MRRGDRNSLLQSLLERRAENIISPLAGFIQKQNTAAMLLVAFTIIALVMGNLPFGDPITHISKMKFGLVLEDEQFMMPISEWISSGLMAFFFFIIGMEVKQSVIAGQLHNLRRVVLVIFAAVGGMMFPGMFYALLNFSHPGSHGWAIPMATDTAFAVGALAVFSNRLSAGTILFLAALAIFDDIGAILVLAAFYTDHLHYTPLLLALFPLALLICINKVGITNGWLYALLGCVLWYFMHQSGVHATLAGLILAFTVPAKFYIYQAEFISKARHLLGRFESNSKDLDNSILPSEIQHNLTEEIHNCIKIVSTPLQRWQLIFINPVSIIIVPLFSLFNAGVSLSTNTIMTAFESPVTWGIITGLVVGKPLGIVLFTLLGIKLRIGILPDDVSLSRVIGIGMVAGIGFTMSVFIANLAFSHNPEMIESAKIGILFSSILSVSITLLWFSCFSENQQLISPFELGASQADSR